MGHTLESLMICPRLCVGLVTRVSFTIAAVADRVNSEKTVLLISSLKIPYTDMYSLHTHTHTHTFKHTHTYGHTQHTHIWTHTNTLVAFRVSGKGGSVAFLSGAT